MSFNELARQSNTGLVVLPGPLTLAHRKQIIALAARNRLPAIYPYRYYVTDGGLISYGLTRPMLIGAPRPMWIASSKVRSRRTFRSNEQPSSNLSSPTDRKGARYPGSANAARRRR